MINTQNFKNPIVVGKVSVDPASPENGAIWYNTTSNTFKMKLDSGVFTIASGGDLSNYLPLSGGNLTGPIDMGTNKITGLAPATANSDAVTYAQLLAISSGNIYLNPILEPDLINDSLTSPPASPVDNTTYIAAATSGAWTAGHLYYYSGTSWVDVLGRAVAAGDRFGIRFEHGAAGDLGGSFVGKSYYIAQVATVTTGATWTFTYTFTAPQNYYTVLVNEPNSQHFGHTYSYTTLSNTWIEVSGPGAIVAGVGLSWAANTLNVNLGAGITQLPSNDIGLDLYSAGSLQLVDPSTGLPSSLDTSQLSVKIDPTGTATLAQSASGLKVATGSISNTHISASAAIVYSKLALTGSIVNTDIASGAAIAYNKLSLSNSIVNGDIAAAAAIAYSKLNLASSILGTDISPSAAIPYNKLSLTSSIVNSDISSSAGITYNKLSLGLSIVNADISTTAAIAYSKLNLTSSIVNADISSSAAIDYSKLNLVGNIVNNDINATAAIAYSKLNLTGNIVNNDISASAAIVYSKLSLANSIVNNDISSTASIAYSKLNLVGNIKNADIAAAAAIAYSKLALTGAILNADLAGSIAASKLVGTDIATVGTITSGIWNGSTIAVANGGTGVTSVTTTPAATAFSGWDANKNLSANSHIDGYTTTATAAGTTTLTVGSTKYQYFTGTTTQTVTLPVVTTLVNGQQFVIVNLSTGVVTVQTSGLNAVQAMAANTQLTVTVANTAGGTGTASWSWSYVPAQSAALPVAMGGTGQSTALTQWGVIYASATTTMASTAAGTAGYLLTSNATSAPTYQQINLGTSAGLTGTLTVAKGGTGVAAVTTAPTATAFAGWDANKNLSANNHIQGYTTTATAAGTTTLTVASTYMQYFTGTTTQTVVLPVATTLANGFAFQIVNNSSGVVTVQTSGANVVQAMAANSVLNITLINTAGGTGTASWSWQYATLATGSVTSVGLSLPSIFTVSGSPVTGSGTLTATLASQTANTFWAAPNGSAGAPTFRAIVAADIPTLNQNTTGTAANITATSNSTLATLSALSLPGSQVSGNISGNAANVTGTVAIGNGGTGQTTQQAAINALAGAVTSGQYLRGNGTNISMSAIQASDVPTLNQNTTGTAANITATTNSTLTTLSALSLPGSQVSGNISGNAANVTGTVAIANGGTGVTSVTSSPTASAWSGWDANKNFFANNNISAFATQTTTGGTTNLTASSAGTQQFTGTLAQTIVLPATNSSGMTIGLQYQILNRTSNTLTVQDSSTATLQVMPAGSQLIATVATSGSPGTWDINYSSTIASSVSGTNVITNTNLAQMAANTIKGNNTGVTANAGDLSVAQVTAMLNQFSSTLQGLTPASGGGTSNFLRADGTWATPAGTGVTSISVASANGFSGTSSGGTTPALTLGTTITGLLKGNGTAISAATAGTDYVIPSGNISGSAGSVSGTNVITNSNLAQMGANTIKGNNTGATANAIDLTGTQVTAMLDQFTSLLQGVVPASGGGTANFLRADGTWAAPSGSGANTTLSNLGTTAINADLVPNAANTINLGGITLPYANVRAYTHAIFTTGNVYAGNVSTTAAGMGVLAAAGYNVYLQAQGAGKTASVTTGAQTGSNTSGDILLTTGGAVSGNSGNINLSTGTSTSGTVGSIILNTPSGGSVNLNVPSVNRSASGSSNYVTESYIDSTTLTHNTTTNAFTFSSATYGSVEITYQMTQATTGEVRQGTIRVMANNTAQTVNIVDSFGETNDIQITPSATISSSIVTISFANAHATNDVTMRADFKYFRA
jgi:hypothetical protein